MSEESKTPPPETHLQPAIAYHEAKASEIWNTDRSGFTDALAKEYGIAWCLHAAAAYDLKKLSSEPPPQANVSGLAERLNRAAGDYSQMLEKPSFRPSRDMLEDCRMRDENAKAVAYGLELAAALIDGNVIKNTSAGKVLSPRQDGNRDGQHYAVAIRALATTEGSDNA